MNQSEVIYLDHAATTPLRQQVLETMLPYWSVDYGNPSSIHRFGRKADEGLTWAREIFAQLLNSEPEEIIFTGSGSESDNLALRGVMWEARASGRGNHLITSAIEHKAVLNTAKQLRDLHGFEITVLPVDGEGSVAIDTLEAAIRPDTVLISIMAASNEIGTIQPIEEIGTLSRDRGILFHTDAVQAAALRRWNLETLPIDLVSFAAHKFYGPKGLGILYVRKRTKLVSLISGGGQEHDLRAGTENVPYAVGAAKAFELAMAELEQMTHRYQTLRDTLIRGVIGAIPDGCILTGHPVTRLANHSSFAFKGLSGNELLMRLDIANIAASSGSACLTGDPRPSSVLEALGLDNNWTSGGLRLTVGRQNNSAEIDRVLEILPKAVQDIRRIQQKYD